MDQFIDFDKRLLVYLNNLGSERWDWFWLFITDQFRLIPFFLLLLFLLVRKISWKQLGLLVIVLALFFLCTDQLTNLVKNSTDRLRPINDPEIADQLRVIIRRVSKSFFSGHASNSMGAIVILYAILRKYYSQAYWLFLFPLVFAYSRIYLGLHFPSDILTGYLVGIINGIFFFLLFKYLNNRFELKDKNDNNLFL